MYTSRLDWDGLGSGWDGMVLSRDIWDTFLGVRVDMLFVLLVLSMIHDITCVGCRCCVVTVEWSTAIVYDLSMHSHSWGPLVDRFVITW